MKILKEKDLLGNSDISEIKNALLYRVYLIITVIGVPIVLANLYFSLVLELSYFGVITTLLLLPLFVTVASYRKTSYKFKSTLLVISFLVVGFYNIYLYAYLGSGLIVLLTGIGLSVVFLPLKKAYIFLSSVSLGLFVFAILFVTKVNIIDVDLEKSYTSTASWVLAILVFFLLSGLLVSAFGVIYKNLLIKLNSLKTSENELISRNNQLKRLIDKQEEYQKEIIAAKIKAEESAVLKTKFIRNLSHEIRTPLNSIVGFSQILNSSNLSEKKRKEFTRIIIKGSNDLQRIIDDILEISLIDAEQIKQSPSKKNLSEWLKKIFEEFTIVNKVPEIDFILENSCEGNESFETDFFSLEKALSNLLHNATKFTSEGSISLGCIIDEYNLKIFVKDTGIGMDPEIGDTIFERFRQGKKESSNSFGGLGLGLYIAKEHISRINGDLFYDSVLGKGSTFFISLPKSK